MSLLEQIRGIEERYGRRAESFGWQRARAPRGVLSTGWAEFDAAMGGGLIRAGLHEWFGMGEDATDSQNREATKRRSGEGAQPGAAVLHHWIPPLMPLVHLVRRFLDGSEFETKAQPRAAVLHHWKVKIVWIGWKCFPHGAVLIGGGRDPSFLERCIFVKADRPGDRLWSIDLALRCSAVCCVVADGGGFDLAATRRIQLVARHHGKPVLLTRPPWEIHQLSAAQTRWLVGWGGAAKRRGYGTTEGRENESVDHRPQTAEAAPPASGLQPSVSWSVELLRCKGEQLDEHPRTWVLEYDRGEGAVHLLPPLAGATGETGASTDDRRLRQA